MILCGQLWTLVIKTWAMSWFLLSSQMNMRDRNFENEWDMPLIFELTYKRRNSIDIAVMLNRSRYTF